MVQMYIMWLKKSTIYNKFGPWWPKNYSSFSFWPLWWTCFFFSPFLRFCCNGSHAETHCYLFLKSQKQLRFLKCLIFNMEAFCHFCPCPHLPEPDPVFKGHSNPDPFFSQAGSTLPGRPGSVSKCCTGMRSIYG